jgi:hypothetical protein
MQQNMEKAMMRMKSLFKSKLDNTLHGFEVAAVEKL